MGAFTPEQEAAALARCEQEPAPLPDRVQDFVDLIGFDTARFVVCVETAGAGARVGRVPGDALLGLSLEEVIADTSIRHAIRNALSSPVARSHRERVGSFRINGATLEMGVYVRDGLALLEIEAPEGPPEQPGEAVARVREMMTVLHDAEDLPGLLDAATRMLRSFSGFDRVKAYRFSPDASGEVVAESCALGIDSYLGLHFPASDIPPQARELMRRVPFRMIPDIDAAQQPVRCAAGVSPDLSFLHGRGISPVHVEYLRNMRVPGTMNLGLVVNDKLWGMFAFHHGQPRRLSPTDRTVTELFGELFAVEVQQRLAAQDLRRQQRVRSMAESFIGGAESTPGGLMARHWADTLRCIDADGVAVLEGPAPADSAAGSAPDANPNPSSNPGPSSDPNVGRAWCFGSTPPIEAVHRLAEAARDLPRLVDCLEDLPSLHGVNTGPSAGVMQLGMGDAQGTQLLLFRDAAERSVRWAGRPEKTISADASGPRLQPRASFAAYVESVQGRCRPWLAEDLAAGQELRTAVVQACFGASRNNEHTLRRRQQSQELLVAELNHRVKNTLALVRTIAEQTRDSSSSLHDYVAAFERRINALATAHDLAGGGGDQWPRLDTLLRAELGAFENASPRIELSGPPARLRPDAVPLLALVLHEMVTNAAKHGALKAEGNAAGDLAIARRGPGAVVARNARPRPARPGRAAAPGVRHGADRAGARLRVRGRVAGDVSADGFAGGALDSRRPGAL